MWPNIALLDLGIFWFGAALGSFLNVCIHRLPAGESIVFPRSHCPQCGNGLRFWENIPLVSFFLLRGRCRACKARIAWRYPMVELLAGILTVFVLHQFGITTAGARAALLIFFLLPAAFIDIEHGLIPNRITFAGMVTGLLFSFVGDSAIDPGPILGLLAGGGVLWGIALAGKYVFRQDSMGGGDIKLGAMIGAFLQWEEVALCLLLSFVLAAAFSLLGMFMGKLHRRSRIPFAPFMAAAAIGVVMQLAVANWQWQLAEAVCSWR